MAHRNTTIGDAVRLARYFAAADALANALAAHGPGDANCCDSHGWAMLLTEYHEARKAVRGPPPGTPSGPQWPTGHFR